MTNSVSHLYSVIFWLEALFLWWWYCFPYQQYRVDLLRHRLFLIRDDLYAAAARGEISFNDPAYGMTRKTLNGMLRFAHELGLLQILALLWADRQRQDSQEYRHRYNKALASLTNDQRALVVEVRHKMHVAILVHVLTTSLLLLPLYAVVRLHIMGSRAKAACLTILVNDNSVSVATLDAAAAREGSHGGIVTA